MHATLFNSKELKHVWLTFIWCQQHILYRLDWIE